jgi:MarR family transcriptional regulator, organic hydroperoxide resistance regulator
MRDQFQGDGIVLDNAIGFWVHRVYQAARNEMYRAFREHGLEITPEQWTILLALWERDGRSQSELCEATFRDAPTMSRMIDSLVRQGLVVRRNDAADARAKLVWLTDAGRAIKKKLVPAARSLVERMTAGIPEQDMQTTREALRRMFANLT